MIYDAITFDTQTVIQAGFRFERGILAQLTQFKGHAIQVVLSEVVVREITNRLISDTRAAAEALNVAERKAIDFKLLPEKLPSETGGLYSEAERTARSRILLYLDSIGARTVGFESASLKAVMELYFKAAAPFSPTGAKKNEFPDAAALLSLEAWADAHDKRILAVSADKDWAAYAEKSSRLDVAKSLPAALETLQQHVEQAKIVVHRLANRINNKELDELREILFIKFDEELRKFSPQGNANSSFEVEFFSMEIDLMDFRFDLPDEAEWITVVQSSRGRITAKLDVALAVKATANFGLAAYDSVDRESVPMGTATGSTETELDATILITLEGDFDADKFGNADVSFLTMTSMIDFGDVEPDWMDEVEVDDEKRATQQPDLDDDLPF